MITILTFIVMSFYAEAHKIKLGEHADEMMALYILAFLFELAWMSVVARRK